MFEDEGNIFPNPDTVIDYQHKTNNKIEKLGLSCAKLRSSWA
jgi:hypothetical protein